MLGKLTISSHRSRAVALAMLAEGFECRTNLSLTHVSDTLQMMIPFFQMHQHASIQQILSSYSGRQL